MPQDKITSHEDVYVLCGKMVRKYSLGRYYYLQEIGLGKDDLLQETMLRLLKYNSKLLNQPSIDSALLCHVVFQHIYYVANTYAKRTRNNDAFIAATIACQTRASPIYSSSMFTTDYHSLLNAITVKSQVEKNLIDLLQHPDAYWQWAADTHTMCGMPSVRKLAAYLKSSAYKVQLAIAHIRQEIQCECLL